MHAAERLGATLLWLAICSGGDASNPAQTPHVSQVKQRIIALETTIEALNQPTSAEKLLAAQCANRGCYQARPEVQAESQSDGLMRTNAVNAALAKIHREIDTEIARTSNPKRLRNTLKTLLEGVSDDPPIVFLPDLSVGRKSLSVAYGLRRGLTWSTNSTFTLRTYELRGGRFKVTGATTAGMETYTDVEVRYLPPPSPGEEWFLFKGLAAGANGPNTRMRVYSFDGKNYRLRWMPENAWGRFTIQVSKSGFRIDGQYYREPRVRHDSYQLSEDGLYRSPD